ncbi:hypothetical protein H4Q26_006323 [Puccinia striiformis f. sp. tritici PST-130]|uniref:Uncharacterized protein n=1 Tax=Puccinia striiformis f. sp. tritici PST-78 TaxID=1165861 RepID=A0A0L0VE69_9BASI|nr:hypothetical protein H4Q26_006323 [Puccinia striiformis f. sp. tritici PST-130]KNE97294.1 hypothetical protein PSTG_09405 [Puccinia striiformis f. sp. tritici PST-78]
MSICYRLEQYKVADGRGKPTKQAVKLRYRSSTSLSSRISHVISFLTFISAESCLEWIIQQHGAGLYQLVKDGVMKTVTGQAHHNSISQSVQEAPNNLSVSPSGYEPEFNSLRNSFDMTQSDTGTGTLRQSEG